MRPSATSDLIMSRMSSIPAGSRPFIGSSRMSKSGSSSRHAATPSRWRMPIEYFDTFSSARGRMPTRSSEGPMRSLAAGAARCGEDLEVLTARQMTVEAGLIDDGPDSSPRAWARSARDGEAEERHRPGIRTGQPQQHPDEGGLAGAVRPEVAEGAAPGNEKLHVVHGDVLPEALRQPIGLHCPRALGGRARQ